MSFWNPLTWRKSQPAQQRSLNVTNGVPVSDSEGLASLFNLNSMTVGGIPVTEASVLTFAAVWACVLAISQDIAALPCQLFREGAAGKEKVLSHPASRLLNLQANPLINAMPLRQAMVATVLLHGNAYARIERNGLQYPTAYYYQHPRQTTVFKGEDSQLFYLFAGDGRVYPASEVIHLRGLVLEPAGVLGKSVLQVAAETVGQALAAQRTGAQFYANGARPSGTLETDGKIDEPTAERLRKRVAATYSGADNAGKLIVLEQGLKFKTIGLPPGDAQFLETRKFSWLEVCAFYRVPPHKTGNLERSTNNNIEQQSIDYVQNTLTPWIVNIEQEYRLKLLRTDEVETCFFRHNLAALLRADSAARGEYYAKMLQNGVYSINEVRNMEELNPAEGGERRYVQVNLMPIDRVDDVINANMAKKAAKTEPAV